MKHGAEFFPVIPGELHGMLHGQTLDQLEGVFDYWRSRSLSVVVESMPALQTYTADDESQLRYARLRAQPQV